MAKGSHSNIPPVDEVLSKNVSRGSPLTVTIRLGFTQSESTNYALNLSDLNESESEDFTKVRISQRIERFNKIFGILNLHFAGNKTGSDVINV